MKKKVVSMMLICAMMAGLVAGCGSKGSDSTASSGSDGTAAGTETTAEGTTTHDYTGHKVTMIYPTMGTMNNQDAVTAALEEACLEETGIELTVNPMSIYDCLSNIQLMIAGGEDVDVFPAWASNIASFVTAQYVLDLTPYLTEEYMPNALQWVGIDDIKCCNVNGYVWGVTTMRERCNPQGIEMRNDILEELGINYEDIKTFDDITEVFAKVHEAYPDMVILSGQSTEGLGQFGDMAYTCDPLNDELGVLANYGEDNLTVVNEFEQEDWQELIYIAREWYEAGYISKDMPTSTDSASTLMAAGNMFAYVDNWKPDSRAEKLSQMGLDIVVVPISDPVRTTTSTSGLGYAVSGIAKDEEASVAVLDWLFGSQKANDIMNWGVEGTDFVVNDEDQAEYPEGTDASAAYHLGWGWAIPNQFAAHLWTGNEPDLYEEYEEFKGNAHVSKAYGFSFDSTNVVDQVIACQAVLDEYLPQLCTGSIDPETGIQAMNDALYAAGLQEVMDEKQAQLDAWAAENGVQ